MIATIIYPREITFDFNVPCLESKGADSPTDILPFVVEGLTQKSGFLNQFNLRPLKYGDIVCVNGEWFVFLMRTIGLAKWQQISRESGMEIQRVGMRPMVEKIISTNVTAFS